MRESEIQAILWSWGVLIGIIGALITFGGGVLGYFVKRLWDDNDSSHAKIIKCHEEMDEIIDIHDKRILVLELKQEMVEKNERS